jgi:hypothetical protein
MSRKKKCLYSVSVIYLLAEHSYMRYHYIGYFQCSNVDELLKLTEADISRSHGKHIVESALTLKVDI